MNGFRNLSPRTAAGLSLVELMIAIALVAIILAGVVKLYADSHRSLLANEGVSRTQEGMRYALDNIGRAAARAGYMGCAVYIPDPDPTDPLSFSNVENLVNTGIGEGLSYHFDSGPVFGTEGGDATTPDTLILRSAQATNGIPVESVHPTTGVVTVDGDTLVASGIDQGDVLVLSDCKNIKVFMMTNAASDTGLVEHNAATIDDITNIRATFLGEEVVGSLEGSAATLFSAMDSSIEYSIGDSAAGACTAATPQFCALLANGQELLQGVENLQVRYGRLSATNNIRYLDADQVAAADWQNIVSIEVAVTLNSVDNSFSRQAGGGGDGLVRKTVTQVIALRNGNL